MNFTDEDLKRLKKELEKHPDNTNGSVEALLTRLEAAEVVASEHARAFPTCSFVQTWRKAAGKEAGK